MKGNEGWKDNFEVAVSRPECKTFHISIVVICHFSDEQIIWYVPLLNDLIIVRGKDLNMLSTSCIKIKDIALIFKSMI